MFFKFTRIQSFLHVTTTSTDRQTCLPCVYIKRHYVLTNTVRALMAHSMENPITLFSFIRGSLYAYLPSTVRGNIRILVHQKLVYLLCLFCFAYPRLRLAFLYIYFLKQKTIKVSTILGMYEMTMYHKQQTWKIQANFLSLPEQQQFLTPFPRNRGGKCQNSTTQCDLLFCKMLKNKQHHV